MTGTVVGVIGAGGFGRDIMPDVARICQATLDTFEIYYVEENNPDNKQIDNCRVMDFKAFLDLNRDRRYVIAIANSAARERIDLQCALSGARPMPVAHNSVSIFDTARIAEGSILCAFTFVGPDVEIGKQFHGNIYSYVEHDCSIGNYVTFAPRASCNGNITIEDHAYIGAGAIIRQGSSKRKLIIGQGAIVGMGAVVLNDVPAHTTVVGNPARVLKNK